MLPLYIVFIMFFVCCFFAWVFGDTDHKDITTIQPSKKSYRVGSFQFPSNDLESDKDKCGIIRTEQWLLEHISNAYPFNKYKCDYEYLDFYKQKLNHFIIIVLRSNNFENQLEQKAQYIGLYCDALLRKKYLFKIYPKNEITKLNKSLTKSERKTIIALCNGLEELTEEEERKLFAVDIVRREVCYNKFVSEYKNSNQFYEEIKRLEFLNDPFTVKRNFYHQAYRFMIDKDKIISLKLYIHYLSINPDSTTNSSISKTNLKLLFENEAQKNNFEKIVIAFKADKNIDKALQAIEKVYLVRKKVLLDDAQINSATEDLNSVVDVLNKYLEDEEPPTPTIFTKQIETTTAENDLSPLQTEFIDYFISKSYKLTNLEIDIFANSKGVFKSQLIEGFNEQFFEQLDDCLIEKQDDFYTLNQDYYKQIAKA